VAEISFASLSPSLLARKGGAKPAMRPQHAALASMQATEPMTEPESEHLEDLGWNDMGEGETASAEVYQLTPMPRAAEQHDDEIKRPVVLEQQDQIAERLVAPAPTAKRRTVRERSRAAFTLRLDADRHLKLRLATTIKGVSAQALVTEALDALLGRMPELDTLAAQVKRH
jgi:hypothetical protein